MSRYRQCLIKHDHTQANAWQGRRLVDLWQGRATHPSSLDARPVRQNRTVSSNRSPEVLVNLVILHARYGFAFSCTTTTTTTAVVPVEVTEPDQAQQLTEPDQTQWTHNVLLIAVVVNAAGPRF